MLTFITTIRHPSHSKSYQQVWDLLSDTVESLLAQTDLERRVVIVCDRRLDLPPDPSLHVLELDWAPVDPRRAWFDFGVRFPILDKGTKYAIAVVTALELGTDHIMFVDSDDFVANDVASYVNANPEADGWYLHQGYLMTPKGFTRLDRFHMLCGTANIIKGELLGRHIPPGLDASWPQDFISKVLDRQFMLRILGNHKIHAEFFASEGATLQAYPSRAAVWSLGTGENVSNVREDTLRFMAAQPPGSVVSLADRERFNIPTKRLPGSSWPE